jgi:phenylpropionate dioxygenase-like ring-hydroxylating dioxygenase large terminal subunit
MRVIQPSTSSDRREPDSGAAPDPVIAAPPYRAAPLRDVWYFAKSGRSVKAGKMTAMTLLGEPVLIGRAADGSAFALRDICPHRGIPLSCGRFDGREVECRYHGWRFDATGQCTEIPSLVAGQEFDIAKIRVKPYLVREVEGNIWVFLGDDPAGAPDIPRAVDGATPVHSMVETVRFRAEISNAVISLIDPAHGPYVHENWFWHVRGTLQDKTKSFVPSPFGFTMLPHRTSTNYRAYKILGGKPETEIAFQLPGIRIERTRVGKHIICNMTAMTPLRDGVIEMNHVISWTMPWLAALKPVLRPFVKRFLRQDTTVAEQQNVGLKHDPAMLYVNDADMLIRWYFRLRNEYVQARQQGRPFVNPIKSRDLHWRT